VIPGGAHALMLAQSGDPLYELGVVHKSIRIRASASATLTRTPVSVGNRATCVVSAWIKRSNLLNELYIIAAGDNSASATQTLIRLNADGRLIVTQSVANSTVWSLVTNAVYRDPAAWYHVVVAIDTTQVTSSDRVKVYVNGAQVSSFSTASYPAQGYLTHFSDNTLPHVIGRNAAVSFSYSDCYQAHHVFIDGYPSGVSSGNWAATNFAALFGVSHPFTGQWRPRGESAIKALADAGGVNSHFLTFNDGSAATAAALGADLSGNGNNWTPTNISVTPGVGCDWMADTPTDNFPVLSQLEQPGSVISDGGLYLQPPTEAYGIAKATIPASSGKWYCETTCGAQGGSFANTYEIGIAPSDIYFPVQPMANNLGTVPGCYCIYLGYKYHSGVSSPYGAIFTTGDVIGMALDMDAGTLEFFKNGVSQGVAYTGISGEMCFAFGDGNGSSYAYSHVNFGQRPFVYTPPSGFNALSTAKLSRTAVVKVSGSFTGNAAANGPFVAMNGTPATLTINGNAVTFGTHADALSNGFKIRTSSASYNASGSNTWVATIVSDYRSIFRHQNAKGN
jgi:hypothetical protein